MYGYGKGGGKFKGSPYGGFSKDWNDSYKSGGYNYKGGKGGWSNGGGNGEVRELASIIKDKMANDMWKEEKKEWDDYEKKQQQDREERERKRVDEMERFKEEIRTQSATAAKEMSSAMKDCMKDTTEAMKEHIGGLRATPIKRTRRMEEAADDDSDPPEAPPRRRAAPKRRLAAAAVAGSGASGAAVVARRQAVVAPVELKDWDGWVCSRATATDVVDRLNLNTPAAELRGLTFEELAERIAHEENGDQQEWKDWHKDNVGEDPKARWSKTQIIQSVLGDLDLP